MTVLFRYAELATACLFTAAVLWLYPVWLAALAVGSPACRAPCEMPFGVIILGWLPLLSVAGVWGLYIAMRRRRRKLAEREPVKPV